ncbi:DNA topoisomerase [Forsythia ovata]|uniref:DNA topoisomerase n=1 Tax=Forsythia ovata TaxID=205694 RepID=A0ABD1RI27_9LAMI
MAYVRQFLSTAAASTSCRLFVMFQKRTVQNQPGSCLWCSPFESADKLEYFPRKARIRLALSNIQPKVLRVKSEQKFHLLRSDAPFSALRQFGYGSSNTAMLINVSNSGLISCLSSTFYVSSRRSFSQVTRVVSNRNNYGGAKKGGNVEVTVASVDNKVSHRRQSHVIGKTKSQEQKTWQQLYPPTSKSVMIVESATKAKVIQGYLGNMFEVLPSYGHVRDLAARSGSVRPDDDFSMVWEVPSTAWTHLKGIKVALSGAENLILASDPDREGEAIAWHIIEMLQQQDALREDINVARVVFNEITESSIRSALQTPRDIDANLVHAYLARRALDYLIGFNISPLLWRKLPGCPSAGRVQSAALALICDREKEIDEFKAQEYWTIEVEFHKKDPNSANSISLASHLTHCDSRKLNQLSISSFLEAKDIERKITTSKFEVISSKTSKSRRNPPPPYITSTLQQDAANKLNFQASYTMKVAQKLYEGVQLLNDKATGLITYVRTDGLHISDEAAKDVQSFIMEKYGENFASKSKRKYFKKVKNAQEAHEAIRPTDIRRLPSMLVGVLDEDSLKLYTLIWSRTMACQMEPAIIEQIQLDIGNADQSIVFQSTCSRVTFCGFQAAYEDSETDRIRCDEDEQNFHSEMYETLSNLKSRQPLCLSKVGLDQHYTQPQPRYSEGSLIRKLEELGIGRPSTYATTIKVLKDRNYVTTRSRILHPEFRGRMVSAFLSHYFSEVTDYSFTADMETELDNVSAGLTEWKGLLKDYWTRFSKYCEQTSNVRIHQVEKMLEKTFGDFLFASLPSGSRTCASCLEGTLIFKVSRFGSGYFIGCDQHPKCKYIAKTLYGEDDEQVDPENNKNNVEEPKLLGLNPGSNEKVLLKKGPYGFYVQLGEDRKEYLPKRASVSQIKDVDSITLEVALDLLRYPVTLGNHPDDDQPVVLKLAKVGFSIRHRRTIASVPKASDLTASIDLSVLQERLTNMINMVDSNNILVKECVPLCYLDECVRHCAFNSSNFGSKAKEISLRICSD